MDRSIRRVSSFLCVLCLSAVTLATSAMVASAAPRFGLETPAGIRVKPLDTLTIVQTLPAATGGHVTVFDGEGRRYFRGGAAARVPFTVAGALGRHTVRVHGRDGKVVDQLGFTVDAETSLRDGTGRFAELFAMSLRTMRGFGKDGAVRMKWRGREVALFVPWVLDQSNTMGGMSYFAPQVRDMVDMFAAVQRPDGMIWSNVFGPSRGNASYLDTVYGPLGYVLHDGGLTFSRQPVENHVEYEFVNMLHRGWQASGDDEWMKGLLDTAVKALDHSQKDPVRWSQRFGLLKRVYTIDSWDFQVDDEYTVRDSVNPTLTINPERSKFGVFFGDNTGYLRACLQLADMLERAGRRPQATTFRQRARDIQRRLTDVSWNGRFFRHFIDEDETVKRDLGVDESQQIAQGNAYSLNRPISQDQAAAIVRTYMDLRGKLPKGSPGEWYAIYPPFGRGFGDHNGRWQYMNGGVAGHAAGELARGALTRGFEHYGVDVLERSRQLAQKTDGRIHFAYTGAYEDEPPSQRFTPVRLDRVANMSLLAKSPAGAKPWMDGEEGNDLSALVTPTLAVDGVPFVRAEPARNRGRAVVAVSIRKGFPRAVTVPVRARAGAVYLVHTAHRGGRREGRQAPANPVAGTLLFRYADGSERGVYLQRGKHVSGWWYPALDGPDAGVAWRGANRKSTDVGLSWAALANPEPDKEIRDIVLGAPLDGAVYAVVSLTLADHMPHHPPPLISYGGPDNWAGANMMAALIEGLSGVVDVDRAYGKVQLSPRWLAAGEREASVTVRYPASQGYVAYRYRHDANARRLRLEATGNARAFELRVLLPDGVQPRTVTLDGNPVEPALETIESSRYLVTDAGDGLHRLEVAY